MPSCGFLLSAESFWKNIIQWEKPPTSSTGDGLTSRCRPRVASIEESAADLGVAEVERKDSLGVELRGLFLGRSVAETLLALPSSMSPALMKPYTSRGLLAPTKRLFFHPAGV
jgi:hypothetical protein